MVQFFQGSYIFQFGFPIEGIYYLMELFRFLYEHSEKRSYTIDFFIRILFENY